MKFDILSLRRTDSVKILYTQRPAHRAGVLRFDPGAAGAGLDDLALEGQGCDADLDERAFFGKERKSTTPNLGRHPQLFPSRFGKN